MVGCFCMRMSLEDLWVFIRSSPVDDCNWRTPSVIFPYLPFTEFQGIYFLFEILLCHKLLNMISFASLSFTDILQSSLKKKKKAW